MGGGGGGAVLGAREEEKRKEKGSREGNRRGKRTKKTKRTKKPRTGNISDNMNNPDEIRLWEIRHIERQIPYDLTAM